MCEVSGAILAGGKSTRMKFNKAFAHINNKTVIEIILSKYISFFNETLIIANEPELYEKFRVKVHKDIYHGYGPIAGIHSALYNASNAVVFISGCDMPFVNLQIVQYMIDRTNGFDAVVPKIEGQLQPLFAVYTKQCLPIIKDCLENSKLKLVRIFEELNTLVINEDEINKFGNIKDCFLNLNDQEALYNAQMMYRRLI